METLEPSSDHHGAPFAERGRAHGGAHGRAHVAGAAQAGATWAVSQLSATGLEIAVKECQERGAVMKLRMIKVRNHNKKCINVNDNGKKTTA